MISSLVMSLYAALQRIELMSHKVSVRLMIMIFNYLAGPLAT